MNTNCQHHQEEVEFEIGSTAAYASQFDQRFSYYCYIPKNYRKDKTRTYSLTVVIHGNERAAQKFRGAFKDYAEETQSIILAPLFPAGIIDPYDLDNYKFIKFNELRFDHILLAMVDEVANKYRISKERFLLFGFSAGAQFAHRFFYLHPERLLGVSLGAPGRITYLDPERPWYIGVQNFQELFGTALQLDLLKQVPVHMIIGSEDRGAPTTNALLDAQTDPYGNSRTERLKALYENYQANGISVQYDEVPGVAHEAFKILDPVKQFFKRILIDEEEGFNSIKARF